MARIRTIKPEFWRHEDLSALPEATHMLAAALLNYADDHGYFNANSKLIQAECSPLREPSTPIPESLRSLQAIGYIRLGTSVDGKRYGHIVEFSTHQRVSHPTDSKISCLSITWDNSASPPENFGKAPETFAPEQGTGNRERNREQGRRVSPPNGGSPPSDLTAIPPSLAKPSDADTVAEMWNLMAKETGLPECRTLTQARKLAAMARVREAGIDGVAEALKKIGRSSFCRGENDRGWRANFDFLIKQSSFTKLMEGHYDDNSPAKRDWSHLDA